MTAELRALAAAAAAPIREAEQVETRQPITSGLRRVRTELGSAVKAREALQAYAGRLSAAGRVADAMVVGERALAHGTRVRLLAAAEAVLR